MKYLLDTDICIYLINEKSLGLLKKFTAYPVGEIGVSSITVSELEHGVEKSKHKAQNREALSLFLMPLEILSYDEGAAKEYGEIRAYLEDQGTPIGSMDMLIAAHARSQQLTVVTNNDREFSRVPKLKVKNWLKQA